MVAVTFLAIRCNGNRDFRTMVIYTIKIILSNSCISCIVSSIRIGLVVMISACHKTSAGDRGSIPRFGAHQNIVLISLLHHCFGLINTLTV